LDILIQYKQPNLLANGGKKANEGLLIREC